LSARPIAKLLILLACVAWHRSRNVKDVACEAHDELVAKFCQHKALQPTLDVFSRCAMFRALDQLSSEV